MEFGDRIQQKTRASEAWARRWQRTTDTTRSMLQGTLQSHIDTLPYLSIIKGRNESTSIDR